MSYTFWAENLRTHIIPKHRAKFHTGVPNRVSKIGNHLVHLYFSAEFWRPFQRVHAADYFIMITYIETISGNLFRAMSHLYFLGLSSKSISRVPPKKVVQSYQNFNYVILLGYRAKWENHVL